MNDNKKATIFFIIKIRIISIFNKMSIISINTTETSKFLIVNLCLKKTY